jgi:hypothetical protein
MEGQQAVGVSVRAPSGEPLRLTEALGNFLIDRGDLHGFRIGAWIATIAAETLRTLQYALDGLLGTKSTTDNQQLMDDIAALVTLAIAAERIGEAGGSALDVFAAYYENVLGFARDPKPLRESADALAIIAGLEELRRLGLVDYADELGLSSNEEVTLHYTDAGAAVGQHLWSRRH